MDLRLRHYFGFAVLLLAVFCAGYGAGGDARAQETKTINIFPANADKAARDKVIAGPDGSATATTDNLECGLTGAGKSPLACTVQELINEADPGDTVIFNPAGSGENPNVYDDLGEVLITTDGDDDSTDDSVEMITIRGMGSGDDMITFTGKILFNVKASHILIRDFKFMDTEVPNKVTIRYIGEGNSGNLVYGFPGVTILDHLKDDKTNFPSVSATATVIDSAFAAANLGNGGFPRYNNELWVSVADNPKRIADRHDGADLSSQLQSNRLVVDAANNGGITSSRAMNLLGTVWVDASRQSTACSEDEGERINVVVRNNVFQNTYLAGVKAGDHGSNPALSLYNTAPTAGNGQAPGSLTGIVPSNWNFSNGPLRTFGCSVQIEVIGNTFTGIGANGPFVKNALGTEHVIDGNKVADLGNMEPAIELSRANKRGTGSAEVTSKISHNTISGGTSDGIVVLCPAAGAKIDIKRNEIRDSVLNGINIKNTMKEEFSAADDTDGASACPNTAQIAVEGNRIYGSSSNRFLTVNYGDSGARPLALGNTVDGSGNQVGDQGSWGYGKPYEGYLGSSLADVVEECVSPTTRIKMSKTGASVQGGEVRAILQAIEPMVWKSSAPNFPFPDSGAPLSPLEAPLDIPASGTFAALLAGGMRFVQDDTISRIDLIRFKADSCFNLGRIRVDGQKGVTIKNNDLGYVMSEEGESPSYRNSPQFGVVIEGSAARFATGDDAFSGNNIDLYRSFAVLNTTGTSISAGKNNYMGSEWEVSPGVTGTNNIVASPVAGETRMVGPDPAVASPDQTAPMLAATGGAVVDGASLTLTFDDTLDAMSRPAPSAFRVMAGASTILNVESVSISGMTVTLTLEAAAREGETITVAYTKPASNAIMDDAGNALESFTATPVTNNSTGGAMPGTTMPPAAIPSGDDGGCALASAGSGVDMGALVLLLGAVFAFGLGRKAKAE